MPYGLKSTPVSSRRATFLRHRGSIISVILFLFFGVAISASHLTKNYMINSKTNLCGKTNAIIPKFNKSVDVIFEDPQFKELSIKKLSGALQIPTEIFDNNPSPEDDLEYYQEFFKLHEYLSESFPLIYQHLKVQKVNHINLVYTWEGKNRLLKPMLFTAHQDVVPVERKTVSKWKFPPFSGHYDEDSDTIWGRGAIDCKTMMIAELEAVEQLLKDGFIPERTIIIAFGFDEETAGLQGARKLGTFFEEQYGQNGIYSIVDEGAMVQEIDKNIFIAAPIVQEKGYVDVEFTVNGVGGHSSIPPKHTTIGIASDIVLTLENNPFSFDMGLDSAFYGYLCCVAEHDSNFPLEYRKAILEAPYDDKQRKKMVKFTSQVPSMRELMRTSQAVDVFNGGMKANALPEVTKFLVNHRIDLKSSVDETFARDVKIAKTIAEKYGYGLYANDREEIAPTELGYIKVEALKGLNPSPSSPTRGSPVWDIFTGTIQNVYENGLFKKSPQNELYITKNTISANSDTKYYWNLTENIYRFFGNVEPPQMWGVVHSVDEHIPVSAHLTTVAFIYQYIVNVNENAVTDSFQRD
ncbi:LAFE_0B00232g1_1 [Lachancea fermentati]|uniref:LAFE_0B00232g1_1 n=1 Tax=Lachancea fermentati TaxID=4955 RepID=A0A1G4M769_LACFM|nr:LAFE_0B00232g1_1 [Lachancea fermentati]